MSGDCFAQRRQSVARAVPQYSLPGAPSLATQEAIPHFRGKRSSGRQRGCERGRSSTDGSGLGSFAAPPRAPTAGGFAPGRGSAHCARAWRRVALGQARDDETAGAAASDDVSVGDELAERPVDGVPRDAEIFRKRSARWQTGVQRERAARDRRAHAIVDAHVRRPVLACIEAGHVDGEHGTRMLGHRLHGSARGERLTTRAGTPSSSSLPTSCRRRAKTPAPNARSSA